MSAKPATIAPLAAPRRHTRKRRLSVWAVSAAAACGLGLLLAGASASDVSPLSDAMGSKIETSPLPAIG